MHKLLATIPGQSINIIANPDVLILGDVDLNGEVDFLETPPIIAVILSGKFQAEVDVNPNGVVNFLDISPFIMILNGSK